VFGCYSQGLLHAQLVGGVLLVQKRGVVQNCSANSIYSTLYPSCYSGPSSLSPVHPHTSIYLSLYVSPSVCVCVCVSIGHTHKTLSLCVCFYRSHPQNAFSLCVSLSVTPTKRFLCVSLSIGHTHKTQHTLVDCRCFGHEILWTKRQRRCE
jgi:hypothetical protein